MVRRWSYLNTLNSTVFQPSTFSLESVMTKYQYTFFKQTTYYRKRIFSPTVTRLTRYSFFRRRHLNNWIMYTNILNNWSHEYLFFRRYLRVLQSFQFFKNNYVTLHLTFLKAVGPQDLLDFRIGLGTFLTSSVYSFFSKNCNLQLIPYFPIFKYPFWLFASAPKDPMRCSKSLKSVFLYKYDLNSLYETSLTTSYLKVLSQFQLLLTRLVIIHSTAFYKSMIQLFSAYNIKKIGF